MEAPVGLALEILAGEDRARLPAACRALFGAVSDVLRDPTIVEAPNAAAGALLGSGYQVAREGAEACLAEQAEASRELLEEARRLLNRGLSAATGD